MVIEQTDPRSSSPGSVDGLSSFGAALSRVPQERLNFMALEAPTEPLTVSGIWQSLPFATAVAGAVLVSAQV